MTPRFALLGVPAVSLLLAGCVGGLLGGGKPDQLLRFGVPIDRAGAARPVAAAPITRRTILLGLPSFPAEVAGDRILTTKDREVSYIKDARWVSSTPLLYRAAVEAMLRERVPDMAVVDRRRAAAVNGDLRIEITRFEAAYEAGQKTPPTVHIEGRATLLGLDGVAVPPAYRIDTAQAASANSVSAIAAAFDAAVASSTVSIADWLSLNTPLTTPQPDANVLPAARRSTR